MKKILKKLIKSNFGKKRFQKFYESLFQISLIGMNYGYGSDFFESGEIYLLKYIKKVLNSEKFLTIFDVGANIGNYSKALADFWGNDAIIHSFEPSKKTFEQFQKTTSGIANIISNNFGLGEMESNLLLYTNYDASGLASVYKRNLEHFGISMDKSEEIKLSTIDNYCKHNNIDRIHFLKLDIEGHELKALKGAEQMLSKKKIDFIQFEFGGCNIDSRTYFQDFFYMLKPNYRIYRILKNSLLEITQYKETQEIFITTNYLAERIELIQK